MSYVDGCVIAVPAENKDRYEAMARKMGELFKQHGATSVVENWGADLPDGELTSFRKAVQATEDECIVFSWIVWPSKEVRDEAHPKVFSDEAMAEHDMPFDGKRLIFGGFENMFSL